jgi:AcrR family transcriptional regulator
MTKTSIEKTTYHHGDLRSSLIEQATLMINTDGINGLSLRKLAEKVGVSRTAAYHHFKDKHELLCEVAAQGFLDWQQESEAVFENPNWSDEKKYRQFVYSYVQFATSNPSLYDLMFGGHIWKDNKSTDSLKEVAYPSFEYQVKMTKQWQSKGLLDKGEDTLRVAQVTWGTLHGIARLIIDGIYADAQSIEKMCDCAANMFLNTKSSSK